jgi:hypothetical protein
MHPQDIITAESVLRQSSAYHDAAVALSKASKTTAIALPRLHKEWESSKHNRCVFVQAFDTSPSSIQKTSALKLLRVSSSRFYSSPSDAFLLSLHVPADIRYAESVSRMLPNDVKRIRLLCVRNTNPSSRHAVPSLMSKLGFKDTPETFVAVSMFADLWQDEVVQLTLLSQQAFLTVRVTESEISRAAQRCYRCGRYILDVTAQQSLGFFVETDDPALKATQTGRDVARFSRLMNFAAYPKRLDGTLGKAIVAIVRAVATSMLQVASVAIMKGDDLSKLPSEPLQSLNEDPMHAHSAVWLLKQLGASESVLRVVETSYPCLRVRFNREDGDDLHVGGIADLVKYLRPRYSVDSRTHIYTHRAPCGTQHHYVIISSRHQFITSSLHAP